MSSNECVADASNGYADEQSASRDVPDEGYVALMDYHKLERAYADMQKRCDGLEDRIDALGERNAWNKNAVDSIFCRIHKLEQARKDIDDTIRRMMRRNGPAAPSKTDAKNRDRSRSRHRDRSRFATPRNVPTQLDQVRAYSCNQHELCIIVNGVHGALTVGNGSTRS
jgi:hypothetical protein